MTMQYYNETHYPTGELRPHYEKVFSYWRSLPASTRQGLHRKSAQLFSGDYRQDPLPRVLTQPEGEILRRGVEQRARAIRWFLQDFYGRGSLWKRVMPVGILRSIIHRNHSHSVLGDLNPESIAFPYGPDIIRDRTGKWRIIEDSAGYIGGIGDLVASRKALFKLVPGFRQRIRTTYDPHDYFREIALHFQKKAEEKGGIPLLYLRPFEDESDQETRRLADIFSNLGIEVAICDSRSKKVVTEDDGIFLQKRTGKTRIGYLILHSSPELFDARDMRIVFDLAKSSSAGKLSELNWTRILKTLNNPPIAGALLKGHAGTNFSPGTGFVNDKMFGLYVDRMIRSLLKETPILESIPAVPVARRSRRGQWRLDRRMLWKLRNSRDRYVVKQVDEDGGDGVWIGHKESRASIETLIDKIKEDPGKYIIQEFEHLSVLENRIVDLRLHSHVDHERIIVSNTPWGRANWVHHNGKVNIRSKGFSSPVVVVR